MQTIRDVRTGVDAHTPDPNGYHPASSVHGGRVTGTVVPHVSGNVSIPHGFQAGQGVPVIQIDPDLPDGFSVDMSKFSTEEVNRAVAEAGGDAVLAYRRLAEQATRPQPTPVTPGPTQQTMMATLKTENRGGWYGPPVTEPPPTPPPPPPVSSPQVPASTSLVMVSEWVTFEFEGWGQIQAFYNQVITSHDGTPVIILVRDQMAAGGVRYFPPVADQPIALQIQSKPDQAYLVWSNDIRFQIGNLEMCVLLIQEQRSTEASSDDRKKSNH